MATIASLQVEITANTAAIERGFKQTNALLDQLASAKLSFAKLTAGFAIGAENYRDTPTSQSQALRTLTKYGPSATADDILK